MLNSLNPYGGHMNTIDPYSYEFPGGYLNSQIPEIPEEEMKPARTFNVDWVETPTEHILMADIPGLTKEDIKVHVDDGKVLEISFERIKKVAETDKWHREERTSGKCIRRFTVPANAVGEMINAGFEKGVLTVTMPKKEEMKDKIKKVEISG